MNRLLNNSGSMLVTAMLAIIFLSGISVVSMFISQNESRITERQNIEIMASNTAEACMERVLGDLAYDHYDNEDWTDGDIGPAANKVTVQWSAYYQVWWVRYDLEPVNNILNNNNGTSGNYVAVYRENTSNPGYWDVYCNGNFGTFTDRIQVTIVKLSDTIWDNALVVGDGKNGKAVNDWLRVHGSIHILGDALAAGNEIMEFGHTESKVINNYRGVDGEIQARIPALPTVTDAGGRSVETLNAEVRIKTGIVRLNSEAKIGKPYASGNNYKEEIDAVYSNHGFILNSGTSSVNADNYTCDSGPLTCAGYPVYSSPTTLVFPSTQDPYKNFATYQDYLKDKAQTDGTHVSGSITINPDTSTTIGTCGVGGSCLRMTGSRDLYVEGVVYATDFFNTQKSGLDQKIFYTGTGIIYAEDGMDINTHLKTGGQTAAEYNDTFPSNNIGFVTPETITFDGSVSDVYGLFFAEDTVHFESKTKVVGVVASNYVNRTSYTLTRLYEVPDIITNIPTDMIGSDMSDGAFTILNWRKL